MGGTASDIRIFISYRRDDAGAVCGSIFRLLKQHFGAEDRVFRDVDSIEPGRPWDEAIDDAVGSCDVCLVLIGPRWLTATGDQGERRLDDEEDRHRREIEVALERKIRLFPVLLEDTEMPPREELPESIRGLRRIQGWRIRDDQTFDWCVEQLIALIEKAAARDADRSRAAEAQRQPERHVAEQGQRQATEREQRVRELVSHAREQARAGATEDARATLERARAQAREIEDADRRDELDALLSAAEDEVQARPEAAQRGDLGAAHERVGSTDATRGDSTSAAKDPGEPERLQGAGEIPSLRLQASDQESALEQAIVVDTATCARCGAEGEPVMIGGRRYCAACGSPWKTGKHVAARQGEASVGPDDPATSSTAEKRACPYCGGSSPPALVAGAPYCSQCGRRLEGSSR